MRLRTAFIGLLVGVPVVLFAQSDTLHVPSMQEVYRHNYWLSGSNPIGISFNRFNAFSIAEVGYSYSSGNLGKPSLPSSSNVYSVQSESFQKQGEVALYGKLGYEQSQNRGQTWNSMINDYWQFINLCDSVRGKHRNEAYHLVGAFSLPIYTHWLLGAKLNYRVQMLAKNTNPRNKNQWSEWVLTPGIGYQSENKTVGLSLLYASRKESVDYQNLGTHASYPFFVAYPLSFFKPLSRDERVKWYYAGQEIGGALQADLKIGKLQFFQQLEGSITTQEIESNQIQDHKEGQSNIWQMNYIGKLQKQFAHVQHEWEMKLKYEHTNNYDPVQQQEATGLWKSYGKVLRATRRMGMGNVSYEYRKLHDAWHPRFSLLSGVSYLYRESALLFYPIRYVQPIHRFAVYTTYIRNFELTNAYLDCTIGGMYGVGRGAKLKERRLSSSQSSEEIKLWQNTELLQQDYDYDAATRVNFNFSVTYTRKIPFTWYIRLEGDYEYIDKCNMSDNNKKVVTHIGLIF